MRTDQAYAKNGRNGDSSVFHVVLRIMQDQHLKVPALA